MCSWSKEGVAAVSVGLEMCSWLVSNDVLELVDSGARLLYVGKTAGYHSRTQKVIHELLLSFAEAGANVVRLKGGDPLVFGRGGEEMDFLRQQGIEVNVIPEVGDLQIQLQNSSAGCHVLCFLHVGSALVIHLVAFATIFP
ncbi:uncharacterized protein LOC18771921 isoform X2 [Prunus persica]|uniref:uncharacterized protein LOC18771921 isoform X2 n=1 Tax=Prunus persica TaxID=3760 RepID=UPI0009AB2B32|nr:uncharacterized protein LOC18771921 isoform X2 [Prunus persica]